MEIMKMNCKPLSVINKSSSLSTKYTTYNLENVEMKILIRYYYFVFKDMELGFLLHRIYWLIKLSGKEYS